MPWVDWRWCAEIDPFASAVLKHHHPDIPNLGDVNALADNRAVEPVDLIVFGSPCQSFSVAGKRLGLDDPRGNMALVGLRVVGRIRPRWVVWENVPGVLSSDGGRDFGAFLGLLGELGYGFAYRVLDAQHFGVPQRRRRVFVVGCLNDWRSAAAVLFEPESLRGDSPPRRETGQGVARPVASCPEGGSGYRCDADTADNLIARCINAHAGGRYDGESETFIAHSIPARSQLAHREDADTLIAFSAKDHGADHGDIAPTLRAGTHDKSHANAGVMPAIAFDWRASPSRSMNPSEIAPSLGVGCADGTATLSHSLRADGFDASEDGTGRGTPLTLAIRGRGDSHDLEWRDDGTANAVLTPNGGRAGIGVGAVAETLRQHPRPGSNSLGATVGGMSVRRLTPTECERLQGYPDGFTAVIYRGKPAADGNRYRALGNSYAIPVVRWIGERLKMFHVEHEKPRHI